MQYYLKPSPSRTHRCKRRVWYRGSKDRLEEWCSGRDLNPGPRLSPYLSCCREAAILDRTILPELGRGFSSLEINMFSCASEWRDSMPDEVLPEASVPSANRVFVRMQSYVTPSKHMHRQRIAVMLQWKLLQAFRFFADVFISIFQAFEHPEYSHPSS
jgi:hypothetical protein